MSGRACCARALERVAAGEPIGKAIAAENISARTFYDLWRNDADFARLYVSALQASTVLLYDELARLYDKLEKVTIAKSGPRVRAVAEQIKLVQWKLTKLAPKVFGDRLTVGGDADNPIVFESRILGKLLPELAVSGAPATPTDADGGGA